MSWVKVDGAGWSWVYGLVIPNTYLISNVKSRIEFEKKVNIKERALFQRKIRNIRQPASGLSTEFIIEIKRIIK